MDFEIVHELDADRDTVERAMFDPRLALFLRGRMRLVRQIELLERKEDSETISRRARYVPEPTIGRVGFIPVKPEWMAWIEESRLDRATHRVEYVNVPTVALIAERMEQRGTIRFEQASPGRTRRVISGSLRIKTPLIGRMAQQLIFPNAQRILEEEARLLAVWLARERS
jgi:hypothetical protein